MNRRITLLCLLMICIGNVGCRRQCRNNSDLRNNNLPRNEGLGAPITPPGVIPPRNETIPPTSVPTFPDAFDPIAPIGPGPATRNFAPVEPTIPSPYLNDPILTSPPASIAPPPSSSRKEVLTPEELPTGPGQPPPSLEIPPQVSQLPTPNDLILLAPIFPQKPEVAVDPAIAAPSIPESVPTEPLPSNTTRSDLPPRTDIPKSTIVALPGFAYVDATEKLAVGRVPTLEGFDKLKRDEFQTVVFVHAPGADLSAARSVVEKRGMSFRSLPTSPETLAKDFQQFQTILQDVQSQPIFFYDDDGLRVGSLWYLHFRKNELSNADAAQIRAAKLGLPGPEVTTQSQLFWLAMQPIIGN